MDANFRKELFITTAVPCEVYVVKNKTGPSGGGPGEVQMARINSKRKGNSGELEVAALLREYGYTARRGLQYQSGQIEADVVGIPGYHLEVKRNEKLNISVAMAQSMRDAKPDEVPVVIHRKNREPWMITLPLTCWLEKEAQR